MRRLGCLVPLLIALIIVGWLGFKAWRIYGIVQSLQNAQARAESLVPDSGIGDIDPQAVEQLVLDIRQDVVDLQNETAPFMWLTPRLGWVPRVGPLLVEAEEWLELADAGTVSAEIMLPTLLSSLDLLGNGDANDNQLGLMAQILADAQPDLVKVEGEVERAVTAYNGIENRDALPWQIRQLLPTIDMLVPLADEGLQLAAILPELMGGEGRKHYLILAQNEDELRATGGYISGIGEFVIEDGDILQLEFGISDAVNRNLVRRSDRYEYPPEPMLRFMGLEYHIFRDANFWPDFPTSAEKAIELYELGQPNAEPVDGVIAINQRFMQLIIEAMEPLQVDGFDGNVTGRNVIRLIRQTWGTDTEDGEQVNIEWWKNRKSFMGALADAAQRRLLSDPTSIDITKLLTNVLIGVEGRDLQIYMRDPQAATILRDLGWDGHIAFPANQDNLFVVDTNLGFNKANAILTRQFNYDVSLVGDYEANLTLQYSNGAPDLEEICNHVTRYRGDLQYNTLIETCNYNYLRLYVPPESQLLSATAHSAPAESFVTTRAWNPDWWLQLADETQGYALAGSLQAEHEFPLTGSSASVFARNAEYTGFENFFLVDRGQTLISEYQYSLPASIVQTQADGTAQYNLTVFKQGGTHSTTVRVTVQLPATATDIEASPDGTTIEGQRVTFEFDLVKDTTLSISYR